MKKNWEREKIVWENYTKNGRENCKFMQVNENKKSQK